MPIREPRIDLVPWDFDSPAHVERMYVQRVACGWRSDEVREKWLGLCREGRKVLYWVLKDEVDNREDIVKRHLEKNPERPMMPIGHLALKVRPEQDATMPPPPPSTPNKKVLWVTGLFISTPLQSLGLGREAMRAVERIASEECEAGWIVLDSIAREQQLSGDLALMLGRTVPPMATQDWYERMGYIVFAEKAYYEWTDPETGLVLDVEVVFLRKELSQ